MGEPFLRVPGPSVPVHTLFFKGHEEVLYPMQDVTRPPQREQTCSGPRSSVPLALPPGRVLTDYCFSFCEWLWFYLAKMLWMFLLEHIVLWC